MGWLKKLRRREHVQRPSNALRASAPERLEPRCVMAADAAPIHLGLVYIESDDGSDTTPDRFLLTFNGGAPLTELREIVIETNKEGNGLKIGDLVFDTVLGGFGKNEAHSLKMKSFRASGPNASWQANVQDGGTNLVLKLNGFRAGDTLEFTVDVDEVTALAKTVPIVSPIKFDSIASGQEFEDSILEAQFTAPHYYEVTIRGNDAPRFFNEFGDPKHEFNLQLPPDEAIGPDGKPTADSPPTRNAAAVGTFQQLPLPIEISGSVWVDDNLNLTREPNETPLPNVQVALWKLNPQSQVYVDTGVRSTTGIDGKYKFGKELLLMPGTYRVAEAQPTGYFSVGAVLGTVAGQRTGQVTDANTLSSIEILLGDTAASEFNFAEARPAGVSGFVYRDDNNNGRRESGEPGISAVSVRLVPINTIAPQTPVTLNTDSNGEYQFTNLAPGTYRVEEVQQPLGFSDGIDTPGTVNGRTVGTASNDKIEAIVLAGNERGIEYNFGELLFGSLRGFVFLAAPGEDCNGPVHADDLPLSGVSLTLLNESGLTVAQTTTNAQGGYAFNDLLPGTYKIIETTPSSLLEGVAHVGKVDSVLIGTATNGSEITLIRLPAGGHGMDYNFCEAAHASIAGNVYHDASNDGRRDAKEVGIPNVIVRLLDSQGKAIAELRTDGQGRYTFSNLLPGTYDLVEIQPSGYLDGVDTAGTVFGLTRGTAVNPGDRIQSITVKQGEIGEEYNFGELVPAIISGRVHSDLNNDCILNGNEQTLAGVAIRLVDTAGRVIAQTVTDSSGKYEFRDLAPGKYTVIESQPAGYFDGDAMAGPIGGEASTPNQISNITLTSGTNAIDNNFCEQPPAELSGFVYVDRDVDCIRDTNEPGIANVRVDLLDTSGRIVATTTTNSSGQYHFGNLTAGEYTVSESQPAGLFQGGQRAGSHGGNDSSTDRISSILVGWGNKLTDYDFCEREPSSLVGFVYNDRNADCVRDINEVGIAGVRVDLINATGQIVATTTTDQFGRYEFTNLAGGQYTVIEHQPPGYLQGGQRAGSHGGNDSIADRISSIPIGWGESLTDYDFCELDPASLSGIVFSDKDGDCIRDEGEEPIEGVRIDLLDMAGRVVATKQSDSSGRYTFDNLKPGLYQVVEHQPDGFYQGGTLVGSGGGRVTNPDHISEIPLSAGAQLTDYNFCEQLGGSISGQVWSETDLNRSRDANDIALSDVLIELLDNSGNKMGTTRTDDGGKYQFSNLAPGEYSVRESQPNGLFHGGQIAGSHGGNATTDDLIRAIKVPAATRLINYNFFELPPATITGYVFQDGPAISNSAKIEPRNLRDLRDGKKTSEDTLIAGVTLELRSLTGEPINAARALPGSYAPGVIRVTTDANGYYQFNGLRPGTYHVYEQQPTGYIDSLDTPGTGGGVAINVADKIDVDTQIIIQSLALTSATDPGDDAILRISLTPGMLALNNNFSEIIVQPLPPPPTPRPPDPLKTQINPLSEFPGRRPIYANPTPFGVRDELFYAAIERDVTWHLSVINAGYPRDTRIPNKLLKASFNEVAMPLEVSEWMQDPKDRGRWRLIDRKGVLLPTSLELELGDHEATPITGDFDGDGRSEIGLFIAGNWFIDLNGNGRWDNDDLWVLLGTEYDQPIVGDWDGDGKDDVGIFGPEWPRDLEAILNDPGLPDPENIRRQRPKNPPPTTPEATDGGRLLRHTPEGVLRADLIDHVFRYGRAADIAIAGDWNGDGIDTVAVFRDGVWMLDVDGDGRWTTRDERYDFGKAVDLPIVGDWDGDGIDDIGVRREGMWIIDTDGDRHLTDADKIIFQPKSGAYDEQPVSGDWDGDGRDEMGTFESKEKPDKAA